MLLLELVSERVYTQTVHKQCKILIQRRDTLPADLRTHGKRTCWSVTCPERQYNAWKLCNNENAIPFVFNPTNFVLCIRCIRENRTVYVLLLSYSRNGIFRWFHVVYRRRVSVIKLISHLICRHRHVFVQNISLHITNIFWIVFV